MTGGANIKGETSLQTIEREVLEELGIKLNINDLKLVNHCKTRTTWLDTYLIRQDVDLDDIVIQEEEVTDVKWATYDEIEELCKNNQFIKNRWESIRNLIKSILYIGNDVKVKIDRPIGSSHHPKYPDHIYLVNYGFVSNTISGDGEELDCYILGEYKPLDEYTGKCIAVIHRLNEDDDKLIIVPQNKKITDKEIRLLTDFQEKYYKSIVIM